MSDTGHELQQAQRLTALRRWFCSSAEPCPADLRGLRFVTFAALPFPPSEKTRVEAVPIALRPHRWDEDGRHCREWEEAMMVWRDHASPCPGRQRHRSHCAEPLALLLRGTFPRRDTTRSSFTSDGAADRSKGRAHIGAPHFCRGWKNKRQEVDGDLVKLYANHLHRASQRTLFVRLIGWN